jgi:tetratricopeptide (TPR) repeat protein
MALFLRQTAGFRLGIALYNDPVARGRFVSRITDDLDAEGIQVLTLDLAAGSRDIALLDALDTLFRGADPKRRAVAMVINLESRVDYAPELDRLTRPADTLLSTANLQRDRFPSACPGPVILWVTELVERALADQAPDLWHWRSHVFELRNELPEAPPTFDPDGRPWRSDDERLHPSHRLQRLEEELAAYRKTGSRRDEMRVLNAMGLARWESGDARRAIRDFEAALSLARELGCRNWEGSALSCLGLAHADLGDARRSLGYHEQALAIARQSGDQRNEGTSLGNLGNAYFQLNDALNAIGYYEQALVIDREIGDRRGEGNALGNLGNAHAALGDALRAVWYYEQQLEIVRAIDDRRGEGASLGNLGIAHFRLGDTRRALAFFDDALKIRREIGDKRGEASILWNSALAHESLGERAEALAQAEAALAIFEAIEHPNAGRVREMVEVWRG